MKRTILSTLLIISFFGNCQSLSHETLNAENAKIQPKTKKTLIQKESINLKNNSRSTIEIYLKTPIEQTDYFKYIFPVLTLLLGIGINKLLDLINENKKIKKSGKRWLSELRVLKNPIEKQIQNIDTFLDEHNNQDKYTFPRPELVITLDCNIFTSLDKTELVKFLENNKKNSFQEAVDNSSQINGFIAILKSTYENFRRIFEEYKQNVSTHTTNVSKNLQGLLKEFSYYGLHLEKELNNDPIDDVRYKPILDLFDAEIAPYLENNNYDIYKLERDFFKQLLPILSNLRHDERVFPMLEHVRNCISEIKAIKMEKYYLDINFRNFRDSYAENKISLPNVIRILE